MEMNLEEFMERESGILKREKYAINLNSGQKRGKNV